MPRKVKKSVAPLVSKPASRPGSRTAKKAAAAPKPVVADADARAAILAAAIKAIETTGLAGVSMRDVARRAGVSHQLPYHYFVDREGILAAIAQNGFTMLGERLRGALTSRGSASERFAAAGCAYVDFAVEHPAHFRVMFRSDFVSIDSYPTAKACADATFELVPAIVGGCVAEGLPPYPNERALVVAAWSTAHGLACLLLDGPLSKTLPEAASARETTTREVMEAMKRLIDLAGAKKPR